MFTYNQLSPNRQAFIHAALEVYPALGNHISSKQIDHVVTVKSINFPQWFIVPENRLARSIYNFPHPTVKPEPSSITEETDEEIESRINETYEAMELLIASVAANTVNSLIISGAPGLGKSYTTNKVLNNINEGSEFNYVFHSGYLKATHLFRLLWENRNPGQVVVIDDCDGILNEELSLNMLKSALELKPERRIGWGSEKAFEDEDGEQIPRYFSYWGSVIFLTNKNIHEIVNSNSKLAPHLAALESRSLVLDLKIKTKREYMIKIRQTVREGMLANKGLNPDEVSEIMEFIEENVDNFQELSLRMCEKVAALFMANPKIWKRIVKAVLFL